jgi:hypothetical protein
MILFMSESGKTRASGKAFHGIIKATINTRCKIKMAMRQEPVLIELREAARVVGLTVLASHLHTRLTSCTMIVRFRSHTFYF